MPAYALLLMTDYTSAVCSGISQKLLQLSVLSRSALIPFLRNICLLVLLEGAVWLYKFLLLLLSGYK